MQVHPGTVLFLGRASIVSRLIAYPEVIDTGRQGVLFTSVGVICVFLQKSGQRTSVAIEDHWLR